LGRAEDVTRRQQGKTKIMDSPLFAERKGVLDPRSRHPRLHQSCGAFGENDLFVRRDVVAMRMGNEGEPFGFPRVQPEIGRGKMNATIIAHLDHPKTVTHLSDFCRGRAVSVPLVIREAFYFPYRGRVGLTEETETGFINGREVSNRITGSGPNCDLFWHHAATTALG
jgi:hypothetical protein